jgi:hypothetical protein
VFTGKSRGLWLAVAVVAGVGLVSLALTGWAQVLVPASVLVLLVMLYGHGTGCPSCGRWWARRKVEMEFVGREVFDKGGVPFARATYQTTYRCQSCRHRWSVASTDEYKDFIHERPKQRRLG